VLIWAARRFRLTGDRVLALYLVGYATGSFAVQSLRIDFAHHLFGLRTDQWAMIAICIAGVTYPDHDGRPAGTRSHRPARPSVIPRTARFCRPGGPGTSRGTILAKRMFPPSRVFRQPHEVGMTALVA